LAHLNPMTRAHESIISTLKRDYHVYVFPVRFIKDGREINTKSFPFTYEVRKSMVESVLGDSVVVLPDYTFYAPYAKYMPPLLSSRSWELRNQIMAQIKEEKFVSYTGDKTEQLMLKAYRLKPLKAGLQCLCFPGSFYQGRPGDKHKELSFYIRGAQVNGRVCLWRFSGGTSGLHILRAIC